VGSGNNEGYYHAILKALERDLGIANIPTKGALAQIRKKVSYKFFQDILTELIENFEPQRQIFHGLKIYAIDGQQIILPRTPDLVEEGFTGRAIGRYRESYLPRGYLTHAYDVLSPSTKDLRFSPSLNEQRDARQMVKNFEKNSLTLYDRLYFHKKLALLHFELGNYFLFRCKQNALKEIKEFYEDKNTKQKTITLEGHRIYLFKLRNPNPENDKDLWDVFATNLPRDLRKPKVIRKLYSLRWEVETSFLELTASTKIEQWHSKSYNGILQELYALFWLINFTKIQINLRSKKQNPLAKTYYKPNFKLILNWILGKISQLLQGIYQVLEGIKRLIKLSTEKRKHYSRSYEREIKSPASPYSYNNTLWQWELN